MTDHAEVMRIAEGLDAVPETGADPALIQEAADALRRQSAETERLRAELEALRKREPVATIDIWHNHGLENTNVDYWGSLPKGSHMLYSAAGAQPALGWLRAVDEAMVCSHLGTAEARDDYATAKRKLNELICWNVAVEKELGAQPAPIQEVYDWPEGATHYQPQQKAFYKRVSACEWYVWSRVTDEPLHWSYSPGTMDSAEWIVRAQPAPSAPTLEALEQEIYASTKRFVPSDVLKWMLKRYYTTEDGAHGITGDKA